MKLDVNEASAALDAVASAKRSVAAVSAAPLWRHAAFAAVMATIVLSQAIDSPMGIPLVAIALGGVALLLWWDRKQTGMFVNGYRRGRTLPLTMALVVATVALIVLASHLASAGQTGLALLVPAAEFLLAFGASLWWERIFLREMGADR